MQRSQNLVRQLRLPSDLVFSLSVSFDPIPHSQPHLCNRIQAVVSPHILLTSPVSPTVNQSPPMSPPTLPYFIILFQPTASAKPRATPTKATSTLNGEAHFYCLWDHIPSVSTSALEMSCCLHFLSDPIPNRSPTASPPNFFSPAHSKILVSNTSRDLMETDKLAEDLHHFLLSSHLPVLSPALQQNIGFSFPPCYAHILWGFLRPSHLTSLHLHTPLLYHSPQPQQACPANPQVMPVRKNQEGYPQALFSFSVPWNSIPLVLSPDLQQNISGSFHCPLFLFPVDPTWFSSHYNLPLPTHGFTPDPKPNSLPLLTQGPLLPG